MKRILFILISLLSIFGSVCLAEEITCKFNIDDFTVCEYKGEDGMTYSRFLYQGKYLDEFSLYDDVFLLDEMIGAPEIPIKEIALDFPVNASEYFISFEVVSKTSHQLPHKIYPTQKRETTGFWQKPEFVPCYDEYYKSELSYPQFCIDYTYVNRGSFFMYPILYYPMEDRYEFISEVKVKLEFVKPDRESIYATRSLTNPTNLIHYFAKKSRI